MEKDDWYFLVSTLLGFFALLGTDWKAVWGHVSMTPSRFRQILLLILIFASLTMSGIGWYKASRENPLHWTMKEDQEERIYGRTYQDEIVEMDGKRFDHCAFTNVRLMYHATAPTDLVMPTFSGKVYLESDSDAAKGFLALSAYMVEVMGHDPEHQWQLYSVAPDGKFNPMPRATPGMPNQGTTPQVQPVGP